MRTAYFEDEDQPFGYTPSNIIVSGKSKFVKEILEPLVEYYREMEHVDENDETAK